MFEYGFWGCFGGVVCENGRLSFFLGRFVGRFLGRSWVLVFVGVVEFFCWVRRVRFVGFVVCRGFIGFGTLFLFCGCCFFVRWRREEFLF